MNTIVRPHIDLDREVVAAPIERQRRRHWPVPDALVLDAMPEMERLLLAVVKEACQRLHADAGSVWLIDPAAGALVFPQVTGGCARNGNGSVKYATRQELGLVTSNDRSSPTRGLALSGPDQSHLSGNGRPSSITVPLRLRGAVIGAVQLMRNSGARFSPSDRGQLEALMTPTGLALEQALETARLRHQVTDLQAQMQKMTAFAHTVAHDLKNPLGLIAGYASFLIEDYPSLSDEEVEESLQKIVHGSHRMHAIIDGLLLLASVRDAEHVEMRRLDTATIVADAQERLRDSIQSSQAVIISPERWPAAMGYAQWVEEVWANYISNAIKYGGQPPRVELGASLEPSRPGGETRRVRFWVRDNGGGLTAAEQARLFKPFTRLRPDAHRGSGLGLSIVQRIVQTLGGEVDVTSQPGQGSVFSFTLPAAAL